MRPTAGEKKAATREGFVPEFMRGAPACPSPVSRSAEIVQFRQRRDDVVGLRRAFWWEAGARPIDPHRADAELPGTAHVVHEIVPHHEGMGPQRVEGVPEDGGLRLAGAEFALDDHDVEVRSEPVALDLVALLAGVTIGDE